MADSLDTARSGLRSVARGTLVMLLGSLGLVAETFVSRVLLTRWLSLPEWSAFSLGLTIAGLLSSFGALGLPQAVARNLPFFGTDSDRRAIVRTGFRFVIPGALGAGGLLALLGVPLAITFSSPLLAEAVAFLGIAVASSVVGSLLGSMFQGYEDTLPNALFNQVLSPGLFILFAFGAWGVGGFHLALPTALAGYAASSVLSLGVLGLYTRRRFPRLLPAGNWNPGVERKILLFALPLLLVAVLSYVTGSADTLVLGGFHGALVGLYANQLTLARLLQVGLGSLGFIFLPVAARFARDHQNESVRLIYATATKWTLLTSLPLFLLFFFLPAESMGFVFGPDYVNSPDSLRIVVVGAFIACLLGPANTALISFGQTRLLVYNTLASAVTNVGIALALVPAYGTVGAAIAWTSANALFVVLSTVEVALLDQVHPFLRDYLLPLSTTLVPLAVLFAVLPGAIPLWTLPGIGLAAAGWFILAVIGTRSIGPGDRLLLDSVESMLGISFPRIRRIGRWGTPSVRKAR